MEKDIEKKILDIVSRETISKYHIYFDELKKWNKSTQLVQEKTMDDFWNRHILDSIQIIPFLNQGDRIVDLGTGAGFPGMPIAMSGIPNVTLCESMVRKCVFLSEVKRLTETDVKIVNARAETISAFDYNVILSRAMTELSELLGILQNVSRETQIRFLFHKGKTYLDEIRKAEDRYSFEYKAYPSISSPEGVILEIRNLKEKT